MQAGRGPPGSNQPPMKIYNAVYSSVQVYECMVRGIAVMRRRNDSYVNATQILKVAGVDKGRRTKILEKEILPGKHEIVQGGYGKYQGTWIPLERGRDIAQQYGVAPLLSPLFDFQPSTGSLSGNNYPPPIPSTLAPPPIMPGSALRLLNQGRAQGLFTPTMSGNTPAPLQSRTSSFTSQSPTIGQLGSPHPGSSQTPPPNPSATLKRGRDVDMDGLNGSAPESSQLERSRPPSRNGETNPSPAKRARTDNGTPDPTQSWPYSSKPSSVNGPQSQMVTGLPPSALSTNGNVPESGQSPTLDTHKVRFASKPLHLRANEPATYAKDPRRASVVTSICMRDDPGSVLEILREISADSVNPDPSAQIETDIIIDEQGHTALHLAASLARHQIVEMLVAHGADVHRGNYLGETPLIRACLSTHNADNQSFATLLAYLHPSIHTLDTSRKSVIHHVVSLAGVKNRAPTARYYLDQILLWIAQQQAGDFQSVVDLQDEHGDTALNIAARVGNRGLVRTLLDVGANRTLPNKLGLRPGDFGVETEELNASSRAEDVLAGLRAGPSATTRKSQDVITDMTAMIQTLNGEFQAEIKSKQDAFDVTNAHLRAATRELAEQRKQIQTWQARCAEMDQVMQRVRNVEKALEEENRVDWSGRTNPDGSNAKDTAGPAFQYRGIGSTMIGDSGVVGLSIKMEVEPPLPTTENAAALVRLRRMKMWQDRADDILNSRLKSLQGASAEKEYQCKKIIALCTGLPIDRVEDMLENLVIAVESEGPIVDLPRISGFMQKVRDGII